MLDEDVESLTCPLQTAKIPRAVWPSMNSTAPLGYATGGTIVSSTVRLLAKESRNTSPLRAREDEGFWMILSPSRDAVMIVTCLTSLWVPSLGALA